VNEAVKTKVRQLYQFLKEANQLRFRPVRTVADQVKVIRLAEMPSHPCMQLTRPTTSDEGNVNDDVILSVKRPQITKCPNPPELINEWIQPHWDDPDKDAHYETSRNFKQENGETVTVNFEDDAERLNAFNVWIDQRNAWRVPEIKTRKAMSFFEAFYDIHSRIEKDGEDLELIVADGNLYWKTLSSQDSEVEINHPILLKRVELKFDPKVPQFTIHDTDKEAELYTSLFVDLGRVIN
jgi:hypothetical protein